MARLEFRETNRWTLVGVEIVLLSVIIPYWLGKKYDWDLASGIVCGAVILIVTGLLFFWARVFRYVFSVAFSLLWGALIYTFIDSATDSSVTPWVAFGVATIVSLALHLDYFRFERG